MDPFGEIIERGDARYRGRFESKQSRLAKVRPGVFGNRWRLLAIVCLLIFAAQAAPIPFWDSNSVTLMMPSKTSQRAMAKGLAEVIGEPNAILNTNQVDRYLFGDGTSVDFLLDRPTFNSMYEIVALKSITIGFFRGFFVSPMGEARKLKIKLESEGMRVQVAEQPDPSVPAGDVVLVLASGFQYNWGCKEGPHNPYGVAILIRRHALQIGGPKPKPFFLTGWK